MTGPLPTNDADLLVSRLGMRLAAGLGEQAATLPHDLNERLRIAREQAVSLARRSRQQAANTAATMAQAGGSAVLGGRPAWWQRLAITLPMLLLVAGLVFIDQWTTREQVLAAADIDTVLLSDDLPPAAYADPGFTEFLRSPLP